MTKPIEHATRPAVGEFLKAATTDRRSKQPGRLQDFSPELLSRIQAALAAEMVAARQQREAFLAGPVFAAMLRSLCDATLPCTVSSDDLDYRRSETLARLGWPEADELSIKLFVSALLQHDADTVESGSCVTDESCPFFNVTFRHHGLTVWLMAGQGTVWTISNQLAAAQAGNKDRQC